ncbi:MAG: hypothetical protein AB7L65_07695 [Hyphomonadaceae bacterium]
MRALLTSLIVSALTLGAALPAYADGMDEPPPVRHHRVHRRAPPPPQPVVLTPAPRGPETVTLTNAFFSGGGVGVDIGTGFVGGGGRTIVNGGSVVAVSFSSSSANASASASSRASARSGGQWGGHGGHKGGQGDGCGCH